MKIKVSIPDYNNEVLKEGQDSVEVVVEVVVKSWSYGKISYDKTKVKVDDRTFQSWLRKNYKSELDRIVKTELS